MRRRLPPQRDLPGPSLRYFSAFAGIGGFEEGVRRAAPGWQCAGFSEIDPAALRIYQHHFPDHANFGDITAIDAAALPDFNLFVGGFPCQPFSLAGNRRGFADTRGTLFFDICRILAAKGPAFVLLENVAGLLWHDRGATFGTVLTALHDLGYDCEWQVLDSSRFGVPQHRERVYILGCKRSGSNGGSGAEPRRAIFPLAGVRTVDSGLGENAAIPLLGKRLSGFSPSQRHYFAVLTKPYNSGLLVGCGSLARFPPGTPLADCLADSNVRLRRFTPLETERLQGFPDGWTAVSGVTETARYRCLGNAVTVPVAEAVVRAAAPTFVRSRAGTTLSASAASKPDRRIVANE